LPPPHGSLDVPIAMAELHSLDSFTTSRVDFPLLKVKLQYDLWIKTKVKLKMPNRYENKHMKSFNYLNLYF